MTGVLIAVIIVLIMAVAFWFRAKPIETPKSADKDACVYEFDVEAEIEKLRKKQDSFKYK